MQPIPTYLEFTKQFYEKAAITPDVGLCCTTTPRLSLPGLVVPDRMADMNYGCGNTVHAGDLASAPTVLYVGVGGGMELLQFAYFSRRPGAVIGVDPVGEMRAAARANLEEAARVNPWFDPSFVDIRDGDALSLPIDDASVDVTAQNCLFNIFGGAELDRALSEIARVLKPRGRFSCSDPVAPFEIPAHLRDDDRLRAMCLSGAITYADYIDRLIAVGFGTLEVRARRPYRMLDRRRYGIERDILLETIEVCAIKDPVPSDGACVFTGRTAIYYGDAPIFDDGKGHVMQRDQPLAVCDKTANALAALGRDDLTTTASTWFYDGGGCC